MTTTATPIQSTPSTPAPAYNPKSESVMAKRIKSAIFHIIALALVAMVLYPALWMITSAFKPNSEIGGANNALWSNNFSFDNFATAMEGIGGVSTLTFFTNSLILAVGAVVGTVLSASISAYAFARINFPGRGLFFGMMIATLLLPFHVVIIPQYIVFQQLGLVDTYVPLLIGKFLAADAFFVFLMVQFMRGLPAELDEAARIDGAGHVRIFGSIMLPLMKPALISTSIFSFIWSWNDFLGPLLYLNTPEKYPLPLALRLFVDQTQSSDYGAMIAMSVLALLPVLVFFLVFQRYIVEGVSTQGLKG
ncbi:MULTISPECIES: carbohydrate ABC transporter permease [Paenarthrobacter]|jgi:multiple sugar transport system permease protein|uniref:carbohydrate ABC transporter permease n=1 Tax=Paenarthrobacter TaxID=1742992 RepID=UPI00037E2BC4|nr:MULTISPECIES: carbohydrate ABC transporter permease [Paenarthrobacter]KIA71730.1 ABC-type sugar transport system, permease component [Arthrobacter sp. MWB30]KQR05897.1 sugar ABC transporter permease [Arthrobacter sp. Leaf145]SKB41351.1 carbohydrate ABC transporter membrane protein 2, CUT1 family [Arthrobacter sp. 31Cvi3.1E]BCW11944.1 sugar ABC transporter permease [Arthrobacter sp. NtRootA2]BCW16028.1 sugar ABC transporter permease [Arthrobacter sp. NtRootA4]BCW24361.1 sugar ABC transporte